MKTPQSPKQAKKSDQAEAQPAPAHLQANAIKDGGLPAAAPRAIKEPGLPVSE